MRMRKLEAKDRRTHPSRTYIGRIDRRLRVAVPADIACRGGMRVYFNLAKDGGVQIGKVCNRLGFGLVAAP